MLDQMKNDRGELLGQLRDHVETISGQSRTIGQLETRLELGAPAPDPLREEGDSHHQINSHDSVE